MQTASQQRNFTFTNCKNVKLVQLLISVKNIPSNEKGGRAPGAPPLGSAHDNVKVDRQIVIAKKMNKKEQQ